MSEPDDDALRWEGDDPADAQRRVRGARRARPTAEEFAREVGRSDSDGESTEIATEGRAAASVALVVYGILVGLYAFLTVGWIVSIVRDPFSQAGLFAEIMYQFGEFLAIAAPALWFTATMTLARHRTDVVRISWLVVGGVILLPWPFLLGAM